MAKISSQHPSNYALPAVATTAGPILIDTAERSAFANLRPEQVTTDLATYAKELGKFLVEKVAPISVQAADGVAMRLANPRDDLGVEAGNWSIACQLFASAAAGRVKLDFKLGATAELKRLTLGHC